MITLEELATIRQGLRAEAEQHLTLYHKALGALELLDHLEESIRAQSQADQNTLHTDEDLALE